MSNLSTPGPLFLTPRKALAPHLRTWSELRRQIQTGSYGTLWTQIERQAQLDLVDPPLTPSSMSFQRDPDQAAHANRDFTITVAVTQRVLRAALLFKVTGNRAYLRGCLEQIDVLIDRQIWVEWRDKAHVKLGFPADLRTGGIAREVAIAYNWLRSSLTSAQRTKIVAGLDRMAIQPFLESLPMDPFWMRDSTNWMTCVVGGMGICGMALGPDHPQSKKLVRLSKAKMASYFDAFGPAGEFNESPGYAGSLILVVGYYSALQSLEGGAANRLAQFPFPQAAHWIQYLTLGPKRIAGFGDCQPTAPPFVSHYAAVAAATRNPTIQGLAQHFRATIMGYAVPDIFELIWLDPSLPAKKPDAKAPRHATFRGHAACFSSRSDWKTSGPACVVYGKAGREPHHAHADAGQVCIDAHGERLIRDLGLPAGGYPADFFGENRYKYYNASALGHNLLTVNDREHPDRPTPGEFIQEGALPNGLGVHWVYDLSACHPEATKVTRTVFHFLPNIVAVIDEARVEKPARFRLRWHTAKPVNIRGDGSFRFSSGHASLSARVHVAKPVRAQHHHGRHRYEAPFHQTRMGDPLQQRREPYVDTCTKGKHCRLLTVFATGRSSSQLGSWQEKNGQLSFHDKQHGRFSVIIINNVLHYETPQGIGSFALPMITRSRPPLPSRH